MNRARQSQWDRSAALLCALQLFLCFLFFFSLRHRQQAESLSAQLAHPAPRDNENFGGPRAFVDD
jgi:hypothetical protein